jgi:hypothetical protein
MSTPTITSPSLTSTQVDRIAELIPASFDNSPASALNLRMFAKTYTGDIESAIEDFMTYARSEAIKDLNASADKYAHDMWDNAHVTSSKRASFLRDAIRGGQWVPDDFWNLVTNEEVFVGYEDQLCRYDAAVDIALEKASDDYKNR